MAASFSIVRYSCGVVAPIQRTRPPASAGLSIPAASILPSAARPVPIRRCISSMKRITLPAPSASSSTFRSRSSNSPRYLVPATRELADSSIKRLPRSSGGTFPSTIRWARPPTMVVFPTPESPIKIGLLRSLSINVCINRRISLSRPMRGVNCFILACFVRSRPKRSRTELLPLAPISGLIPIGSSAGATTGFALTEGTSSSNARALLARISSISCAGLIPSLVSNSCVTPSPSLRTACAIARSSMAAEPELKALRSAVCKISLQRRVGKIGVSLVAFPLPRARRITSRTCLGEKPRVRSASCVQPPSSLVRAMKRWGVPR